jgi:NTE family protein
MKKIGIVLSGGGARGIAHLGILKALAESGIRPDIISGTSAGGIVGAFYAAGYSPEEILGIAKHADLFSIFNLKFYQGIFSMNAFDKIYLKHIPHNSFEKLNIPLYVTATDILKGETVYFSSGELAPALMATSCVPIAFQPVAYQGTELLDGGILNNLPLEPLMGKCDAIIGVHVNSIDRSVNHVHTKDIIDRSFHLMLGASVRHKADQVDLFIEPPDMSRFGMFDIAAADDIFKAGYDHAVGIKDRIELFRTGMMDMLKTDEND